MKGECKNLKEMVQACGFGGYKIELMLHIVEPQNVEQFRIDLQNPSSKLAQAYRKGKDKRDFQKDMDLWERVKRGDLEALEQFEKRFSNKG